MSDLRNQLQNAKADYESASYPGDLAADVFAQQATRSLSFWRHGLAIAAGVAIVIGTAMLMNPSRIDRNAGSLTYGGKFLPTTGESPIVDITELAVLPAPEAIPESSSMPDDLPLVPSMTAESIPSPPSLASMDFSFDQTSF